MFKFAHDVRSYLRTIVTRIELVQNSSTAILSSEDQLLLQEAVAAARDIGTLMTAMVAFSEPKIDGAVQPLGLLIRGVVNDLDDVAQVDLSSNLQTAVPASVKTVLKELIANSCRFRAADRPLRISIATRRVDAGVEVIVTDNGIGVAKEFLQKIFTPFYRLHSRDEFPGHGLGLPMCQKLVESWGGTIKAEPAQPCGLSVHVTLPD